MSINTKTQKIFLYISIGLYIISLTQKSYCTTGVCEYFSGLLSLIFGWIGIFMLHAPALPWLANPILIIAWMIFKKKPKASLILSIISFLLMLSFLFFDEIIDNEAPTTAKITSYGLGYWLWVLSSLLLVVGNLIYLKKIRT